MAGLSHEQVQERLELQMEGGLPLTPDVLTPDLQAHLNACAQCRAHLKLLQDLQLALLEDVPALSPPPELRAKVLGAARSSAAQNHSASAPVSTPATPVSRKPGQRWWFPALGAAALVGGLLLLGTVLLPTQGVAAVMPDPAVVVNAGGPLVIASNDRHGTISVVRGEQVTASLRSGGQQPAWFTEGVRLGDRVYLADAANDRVLEVQPEPLQVVRSYPVPDGIAGLTASSGPAGGRVYFKGARGEVGALGGEQITIAQEPGMPLADVMDGVLLAGGHLWVTHHVSGEVCLLDPGTLEVQRRIKLGGMPVALEHVQGGVLVLDVTGRLLRLNLAGDLERTWQVGGHPDKLGVNADLALLTDRSGTVTRINLSSGQISRTQLAHPMDVVSLPGGQFAVAEGGRGLRLLDGNLQTMSEIGPP